MLAMLLFRLLRSTPEQSSLAACGYDHYRRVLARLSALLGLHYSPHSCRAGFATEAILRGDAPQLVQRRGRWASEASFLVYIDVATALQVEAEFRSRALDTAIATAGRDLMVVRMGLPVTVEIGDASEDEPSEQLHNSPEQAVATRRSRAMTPPPRVMQARPAGRRPKIDGTSVLSREARAHLGSVGGSAAAGGAVLSEGTRRGQQRRKPVTWCNWLWKSGGKALKRMRALLLWGCVAYVVAAGPLREMLAPIQRDYWVASGVVSYASSGLVVFEFRLLRMVFSPRWANPVWQLAGWNAADEYEQVLRIARDFAIT
ncbi:unnamed protein product, partial [Symbiodinium microadriaticum]